jgi:hypothetical protein
MRTGFWWESRRQGGVDVCGRIMDLREIGWDFMYWIDLAQDMDQ